MTQHAQSSSPRSPRELVSEEDFNLQAVHSVEAFAVVEGLRSDASVGLSEDAVRGRHVQFGANVLQGKDGVTRVQVLVRQFQDVLIIILFLAAAVSTLVGEWTDAITILAIIVAALKDVGRL